MSLIVLCSATGAPGVTTTALAAGWVWPVMADRTVVVVDADPTGSGTVAGLLRAELPPAGGVLALAGRSAPMEVADLLEQSLVLGGDERRRLLAGITDPVQAGPLGSLWWALGDVAAAADEVGVDVLVDAGRLGHAHEPLTLLRQAQVVAIVLRSSLRSVAGARSAVRRLRDLRGPAPRLVGVLVGDREPYSVGEIAAALDIGRLAEVAHDQRTAAVLGGQAPGGVVERSPLLTSARAVVRSLTAPLAVLRDVTR